jgi:hypothetical protein
MAAQNKSRCNMSRNGSWQNSFATDSVPVWAGKDTVQGNRPDDYADALALPNN